MSNKHSEETISAVRALAEQGLSAAQAAEQMGMTRNAVIGLAHRNGIAFGGDKNPNRVRALLRRPNAMQPALSSRKLPESAISVVPIRRLPRCVWHCCTNEAVDHKPYCSEHMAACRTGIMRKI